MVRDMIYKFSNLTWFQNCWDRMRVKRMMECVLLSSGVIVWFAWKVIICGLLTLQISLLLEAPMLAIWLLLDVLRPRDSFLMNGWIVYQNFLTKSYHLNQLSIVHSLRNLYLMRTMHSVSLCGEMRVCKPSEISLSGIIILMLNHFWKQFISKVKYTRNKVLICSSQMSVYLVQLSDGWWSCVIKLRKLWSEMFGKGGKWGIKLVLRKTWEENWGCSLFVISIQPYTRCVKRTWLEDLVSYFIDTMSHRKPKYGKMTMVRRQRCVVWYRDLMQMRCMYGVLNKNNQ